jgi:hypothetical protein
MLPVLALLISMGSSAPEPAARTLRADVWADNWFALYVGNELIKEDSVAYNTERSFNAESFSFDVKLPAQMNVIIKDFKENDTGLEYIGRARQQIGDGGFIAQFFDSLTDELIAVSSEGWRCLPIHRAPLNKSCSDSTTPDSDCEAEILTAPDDWMLADFDDSDWPMAVVHSERAVRPHGGYDIVFWEPSARLIWSGDLETDNTVLCRFRISTENNR